MGKTSRERFFPPGEFKVTTPRNLLINNQAITNMRNLTIPWSFPKYKPTVEPLLQYPIRLDLIVAFFPLMHKSTICD